MTAQSADMGRAAEARPSRKVFKKKWLIGYIFISPWLISFVMFDLLPIISGFYRLRVTDGASLAYIGQTGRSLRERLRALRLGTFAELMPLNDPHTAASAHWAERKRRPVLV